MESRLQKKLDTDPNILVWIELKMGTPQRTMNKMQQVWQVQRDFKVLFCCAFLLFHKNAMLNRNLLEVSPTYSTM